MLNHLVDIAMVAAGRPKLTMQALLSLIGNTAVGTFRLALYDDKERLGAGAAHNRSVEMLSKGRGSYLYISDNDMYFDAGWLGKLLTNFAHAEILGFKLLGGYNHPYHKPAGWEHNGKGVIYPGVLSREIHENYCVGSASWLMRWETWDKYGPLGERKGINQSEDVEFCNRIRADGFKVGKVFPHVVHNCGVTGTFGAKCPGADWVEKEMPPGVYWE